LVLLADRIIFTLRTISRLRIFHGVYV
jgi:hypothetical protein